MSLLVLDLDETVIVSSGRRNLINPTHILSSNTYKGLAADQSGRLGYINFHIINPEKIANLIEYACANHNNIMILTSGLWLPCIRNEIANNLNISEKAKDFLKNCYFHSAYTDSIVFNIPSNQVQILNKNIRLSRIIDSHPELAGKYSTVLDNSPSHIASFKNNRKVKAVLATTSQDDTSFYRQTKEALDNCRQHEDNELNLRQHGIFGKHLKKETFSKSMAGIYGSCHTENRSPICTI